MSLLLIFIQEAREGATYRMDAHITPGEVGRIGDFVLFASLLFYISSPPGNLTHQSRV